MILYFDSNRSLSGRNAIADHLTQFGFKGMDFTGGQASFEDGDLESFGKHIVEFARKHDIGIHDILRMEYPGLGLTIPPQWLEDGLESGRFQRYEIPQDIYSAESGNEQYECVIS